MAWTPSTIPGCTQHSHGNSLSDQTSQLEEIQRNPHSGEVFPPFLGFGGAQGAPPGKAEITFATGTTCAPVFPTSQSSSPSSDSQTSLNPPNALEIQERIPKGVKPVPCPDVHPHNVLRVFPSLSQSQGRAKPLSFHTWGGSIPIPTLLSGAKNNKSMECSCIPSSRPSTGVEEFPLLETPVTPSVASSRDQAPEISPKIEGFWDIFGIF